MVNADAADQKLSFEFNYQALTAYATGAKEFTADGVTYALAEDGGVTLDGTDYAYISRYLVQAISPDVFLSRDFKDKLLATIATAQDGKATFTYTDESLIMNEPEQTEDGENANGQTSGINTEDPNAPKQDDTSTPPLRSMIWSSRPLPTAGRSCRRSPAVSTTSTPSPI